MGESDMAKLEFANEMQIRKGSIVTRPKGYFSRSWIGGDFICKEAQPSGRVLAIVYKEIPCGSRKIIKEIVVDFGLEGKAYIPNYKLYYGGGRIITTYNCGMVAL